MFLNKHAQTKAAPNETTTVRPLTSHLKNLPSKMNRICGTLLEKHGPRQVDVPVLVDQQEIIYISTVRTKNVVWKTCREQWMIRMDGERALRKSILSTLIDDDDEDHDYIQAEGRFDSVDALDTIRNKNRLFFRIFSVNVKAVLFEIGL